MLCDDAADGIQFLAGQLCRSRPCFGLSVHPKIVSERLGHSSVGITLESYSHVLPRMQEEAARRLDQALRATLTS